MRYLLLFILLLPIPADAIMLVGFGAGGGSCTTQTYDVQYTTKDTYWTVYDTLERGQSWQSGVTGALYSFSLQRDTPGTSATITYRIGTSSDLSSYLVEGTCTIGAGAGWKECVITAGSRPSLTSSTTYYLLFINGIGQEWTVSTDNAAGYANGTSFWDDVLDWSGTVDSADITIKTRMCD